MKRLLPSVICLLCCLFAPGTIQANDPAVVSTEHATVTLMSEPATVAADQTLWLGLRFELIPHWHVYWRNPGASGTAPVIRWTLPVGWETGEVHWPVPKRIRVGPLVNYGYEDAVVLLVPVRVPPGPLPAGPHTITADTEWLVCQVECIPETGRLALTLDHTGSGTPTDTATHELFNATRAQWPEPTTLAGRYRLEGDRISIAVGLPGAVSARAHRPLVRGRGMGACRCQRCTTLGTNRDGTVARRGGRRRASCGG